jgi:hypothetical protein
MLSSEELFLASRYAKLLNCRNTRERVLAVPDKKGKMGYLYMPLLKLTTLATPMNTLEITSK